MLNQLVEQLDLIPILDEPAVQRIKQYIMVKFPTDSGSENARTLANTVHRVMDRELAEFSPTLRNSIRLQALEAALGKASFSLNAGDLFQACVKILPNQSVEGSQPEVQAVARIDAQVVAWLNRQRCHPCLKQTPPVQSDAFRRWLEPACENHVTKGKPLTKGLTLAVVMFLLLVPLFKLNNIISFFRLGVNPQTLEVTASATAVDNAPSNQLPSNLKYKEINASGLKAYLQARDSLLAQEPYFTTVVESSREFDVNPLVLFAIAGHEQGFVPRKGLSSSRIINNPFNVFHSWQEYNTTIRDSSRIAARTVVHAAEGRPEDVNPFLWLNRRYAEDVNWWKGVNSIFSDLEVFQR